MKSNEVGTTLKHPETINGNVKNLSKSGISFIFHFYPFLYLSFLSFYFKNLTLPLGSAQGAYGETNKVNLNRTSAEPHPNLNFVLRFAELRTSRFRFGEPCDIGCI